MWFRRTDHRGWREAEYLAVDFETTTGDPRPAEPLSVGWVPVCAGRVRIAAAGYHVIAHEGRVPEASLVVHQLLPHRLGAGDALPAVAAGLRAAAAGRIVVAHGAWVERALLDRLRIGHAGLIDTLAVVRRLDQRAGRVAQGTALSETARRYGVPALRSHHAFGDALTTALLLLVLASGLERERRRCSVDDLRRLGRP